VPTRCRGSWCTAKSRASPNGPIEFQEESTIEIRKIITTRETVFSELGVEANRPITRAVGMAVIRNPFAGQFVEDLRPLFEAGTMLGERLMPELVKLLDGPAVSYGKGAIVGVAGEMEHGALASTRCSGDRCGRRSAAARRSSGRTSRWPLLARFSMCRSGTKTIPGHSRILDTITVSVADAPRPDENPGRDGYR